MTRVQKLKKEIESSDSEREDFNQIIPKLIGTDGRSTSKTLSGRIRRRQRDSGASWNSSLLKWNLLQPEGSEDTLSGENERIIGRSLAHILSTKKPENRSDQELPLSDPRSWVWEGKKDAKLAVAIDAARGIFGDSSRPLETVSKDVDLADGATHHAHEPAPAEVLLDRVESSLLLLNKPDHALAVPLKQTSIAKFFGNRVTMAGIYPKPADRRLKKGSRAITGVTPADPSSCSHESLYPSTTEDDETAPNKGRGVSKSATSTPPTSTLNTPEPTVDQTGRERLPRTAKRKLPKFVLPSASDIDASSVSDFHASGNESDATTETQSATDCQETEDSDAEEDDHVILHVAKRMKPNNKSAALASDALDAFVDEVDSGDRKTEINARKSERKKTADDYNYTDKFTYKIGIDEKLKPISKIHDIFGDVVDRARKLGFDEVTNHLQGRKLKVATMCSGTESPLLAMQLVSEGLKKQGEVFEYEHLFSAEIVPYKQAYIERNFRPKIIYRDIKELSIQGAVHATTAYGGQASIPDGVDLLVAGFSCVDFSNLNNEKKTLKAGGESGDTFGAIKDYAEKYRPKIIILENVDGAPWKAIRDTAMPQIGYAAEFLKVDTKHYYIPQTRKRGYMICVDAREYHDPNGKNHIPKNLNLVKSILSTWANTLKAFRRPASCPVEAFLLNEDDPRAIQGRAELANSGRGERRRTKEVDWARCHGRHQDYRAGLFLGQKRPLTKWEDGGSCKPSDYMWQDWMRGQVERVWDTVEISWLRNLNRGFDHQYKSRLLELSQNVDRVVDNTGAGLAGCITPTGIPFSTIRGGPLIGLEALSLQGLPIDQLQLTREKQVQLQDLAGNAMSSTVVGPAILAALIAGYKILLRGPDDAMEIDTPSSLSKHYGEDKLIRFNLDLADYSPASVDDVLEAAAKSIRLCLCEGRTMITTTALQQCCLCKHTTCVKCGGNPSHKYVLVKHEVASQRIPPANFEDFIRKAIPMKFMFSVVSKAALQDLERKYWDKIESKSWKATVDAISKALGSELHFRSTKRSELWTISYESDYSSMELVLSQNTAEWRLYAKPSATEPVSSDIRKLLSKPIARMQPTGADIVEGLWQFWLPKVYKFDATIQGSGALTRSFESVHGIAKYAETEVWEQYLISVPNEASQRLDADISGKYRLLQECGSALGSLHIRDDNSQTSAPLFLFLDPDRLQHPMDDNFVFSSDKRRLNYGESRSVIARVGAAWRPQKLEKVGDGCAENVAKYNIDGVKEDVTLAQAQLPKKLPCYVDGQWVDLPDLAFDCSRGKAAEFRRAPSTLSICSSKNSCQVAHAVLHCEASLPEGEHSAWQLDDWTEIPLTEYNEFFSAFAWLTQKACTLPGHQEWEDVFDPELTCCQMCAPDTPGIKWRLEAPKQAKKKGNAAKPVTAPRNIPTKLVAFEDPVEAAVFERMLKNRPSPLVTQIHIDNAGRIKLRMAVNPQTLMHRAFAKLSSSQDASGISLSWRLCTNQSLPTGVILPAFTLMNNDNDQSAEKPPGFLFELRPEQSRSLAWMIQQERDEIEPFVEEEVEEASIPQIGWRAEGRARKPIMVRGGVLADQVGYGKTVTTLGLIDTQRRRDREAAKISVKGRIPLKATLILVPPQLPDQWDREIKKFLDKKSAYNVLVIKTIATLRKMTIARFQSADIIILSWKVCEGDAYLFDLAQFAGVVELPKNNTRRSSAVWYDHVLTEISENVDELKSGGKSLQATLDRKLDASKSKAACEETYVPSKRLRGQAYQNAKQRPATGNKRAHSTAFSFSEDSAQSEDDPVGIDHGVKTDALKRRADVFGLRKIATGKMSWTAMMCPLLELFEFGRIVVDEYTYITGQESFTIPKLKAKIRWILSATPPLRDFADVKCISKFLGINLGVDDLTPGVIKAANIRALEKERTDCEQFQSFKMSQSAAWHENRNTVAQRFLNQFVRQNIADIEAIKGSTHLMPIVLPAAERAIYLELNQLLAGNDFKMKRSTSNTENDRARRIREILGNSGSAGEALMKCASHFTLHDLHKNFKNAPEACDVIVKLRQSQYKALTADFKRKLRQAEWLEKACSTVVKQYGLWKGHVNSNQFGDLGVMDEIKRMMSAAELNYDKKHWVEFYITPDEKANMENAANTAKTKNKKCNKKEAVETTDSEDVLTMDEDSDLNEEDSLDHEDLKLGTKPDARRLKPEGFDSQKNMERAALALRDVTNDLRKLSTELVNRRRCLRFFECVRKLQRLYSSTRGSEFLTKECSCSKCGAMDLDPGDISILSQCGHAICSRCLEIRENRQDECLILGCNAVNKAYQVVKAPELGVEDDRTRTGRHYGRKLEDIIQLVQSIHKDDQVLLFVQFVDLMNTITSAMKEHGISFLALGESSDASRTLTEFQTNFDNATKKKVLILNIGDASAAGSNLTNANHVIFVSPFLTESQQTYDQAMTQAMGRARRYGQTKPVHVYNFISLKTIDVDTLQLRSGKVLANDVVRAPEFLPFESFTPSAFGLLDAGHGEKGEFGSAETSKLLMEIDDA